MLEIYGDLKESFSWSESVNMESLWQAELHLNAMGSLHL